jgi:UDP-N-acetylmuramoyl-L-alanyl-D-glutamate--2,6-diaminopimelate ligase
MTLAMLLQQASATAATAASVGEAALACEVTGVAYDSRRVQPGAVFVALRGLRADGVAFVEQAITRGALAVVAEAPAPAGEPVPWITVRDARLALAELAAAFYRHPSQDLVVVGITGTNGKTTTSYLLSAVFERAGLPCGRIGTVSYRLRHEERDAPHTTPEAPDLQALLRTLVGEGCGACVMEVSSHALALRRADAIRFAAGVFTNLTRDHLDFHGGMENYFAAKRRLFELLPPGAVAVVNLDDPHGPALVAAASRPVTYAIDRAADVTPGPFSLSFDGLRFDLRTPRGLVRVASPLVGRPNVYNILAAAATAMALDVPFSAIERGLADVARVPGRFQVVSTDADDVKVVVDYAHTDDALKNLLETARPLATGRVITVFGCGGDRDRTKRPLMGAVAARLSDVVVITSDNPRSEDPLAIIEDIKRGLPGAGQKAAGRGAGAPGGREPVCLAIPDRREAIERAIREARAGDLVLVAGKGHERYQVIGDRVLPFDDVEVAAGALQRRRANSAVR